MNSLNITIKPEEKASRVELLIRFVYWIPLYIVLIVLGIISWVCIAVNFITSLILGKRIASLSRFVAAYIEYSAKFQVYLFLSDERPEIIPKS